MAERLLISRIGHRGDGVADTAGGPLYVPCALPGETVIVDAGPADRRRLVAVAEPSADRVAPICQHFGTCGGCALQHMAFTPYRAWKRNLIVAALGDAGIDAPVADLVDAHGEGRRRAVFHARMIGNNLVVGFAAARAHEIVPVEGCPILAPGLAHALDAARDIAGALRRVRKPLDIHITATDAGMDVDVRGSGPIGAAETDALARLAEGHGLARLTRHGTLVVQRTAPTLRIGRATIALPPAAFLQATAAGEEALAGLVLRHLGTARRILDLFAGIGPFALRLAERAAVRAVDLDEPAIAALRRAAGAPGLKPIETEVRDLFRRPLTAAECEAAEAIVFDPPRRGAEMQARELARARIRRIVAVSCNPATFARDARILREGGYRLTEVTPVDQFRYSPHVEVVGCFER